MRKTVRVRAILLSLLMVGSVLAAGGIVQAQTTPEVTIEDLSDNELDDSETVSLLAQDVGSDDGVGAFEIEVEYNDSLLQLTTSDSDRFTVTQSDSGSGPTTATIVGYTGETDETPGSVDLADIELTAKEDSEGSTTSLTITSVETLADTDGDDLGSDIVQPGSFEIVETAEDPPTDDDDDDVVDDDDTATTTTTTTTDDDDDVVDDDDDVVDDDDDVVDDDDDVVDDEVPDAEDLEPETPTIEDVRQDLDRTEPNTRTSTPIVDNDPDRPGVQVNPEGTESVREISFSSDTAEGNVDISEWQDPPESVSQSVAGSVTAQVEADAEANIEASANVPTVADIDPDTDEVRGDPATVQMTVDADRLDNPEDATIAHERGDTWETLETTVTETEDGEVTLEAETESFSLFAVAEVETEEEPADPDGGIGTTGLIGLLVVLALIVAAAVAYRQMNDGGDNTI